MNSRVRVPARWFVAIAVPLTLAWFGEGATAPLNQVFTKFHGQAGCCQLLEEDSAPVLLQTTNQGHALGFYSVAGSAAPGNVMLHGINHLAGNTGLLTKFDMVAVSSFDDLIFTDGTGVPKPVTFWVNVEATGSVAVSYWDEGTKGCMPTWLQVSASPAGIPNYYLGAWDQIGEEFYCPYTSEHFFAGDTTAQLSKSLHLGPFSVNSEEPITIELRATITPWPTVPWLGEPTTVDGYFYAQLSEITAAIESPGFDANSAQANIVNNVVTDLVAVETVRPGRLSLAQNAPNPLRSGTSIAFDLPRSGDVRLSLFDIAGREVRELASGWFAAGAHVARWDGRDESGRTVSPGIYFYRLQAIGEMRTRSLVVAP